MATRVLESRFEHLSVNDENDPTDGSKYQKSKVIPGHKLRYCAKEN
jgi:aurora kinase